MLKKFGLIFIFIGLFTGQAFAEETFSSAYKKYNELVAAENYSEAHQFAQLAYEKGKDKFKSSSAEMATLAYNLGFTLNKIGNHKDSLQYLFEARQKFEDLFGENDIKLFDPYMEIAEAHLGQGDTRDGKRNFRKAMKIAEIEYGPQSPYLVSFYIEIGNKFLHHNSKDGEEFFQEALLAGEAAFPEGDYRLGVAAFSLGKVYQAMQKKKKAEEYYMKALQHYEKAPPPDMEFLMVAHTFLVQLYAERGDEQKATYHCVEVGKLRGDGDIDSARPLYKMRPYYPLEAQRHGIEGSVLVEYKVGADGRVYEPEVLESDHRGFSEVALETIQQWRYAPRVVEGEPVQTEGLQYRIFFSFYDQ